MKLFETTYKRNNLRYSHIRIKANSFGQAEAVLNKLKTSKFWTTKIDINTWKIEGQIINQIPSQQKLKDFKFYEKQFNEKRQKINNKPQSDVEQLKPQAL